MRGTASPPKRREPTRRRPWAAVPRSPGASHQLGCTLSGQARPRIARAGRARLHYVEREDPGHGHLDRTARDHPPRGTSPCPQSAVAPPTAAAAVPAPAVATTTQVRAAQNRRKRSPRALDKLPLTLVSAETSHAIA